MDVYKYSSRYHTGHGRRMLINILWPPLALAITSNIHRQMPTHMANTRRDWLTNQNTDWCFVVIGLVESQSHSPLQQLKINPVRQLGPPYWLAPSGCQRILGVTKHRTGRTGHTVPQYGDILYRISSKSNKMQVRNA